MTTMTTIKADARGYKSSPSTLMLCPVVNGASLASLLSLFYATVMASTRYLLPDRLSAVALESSYNDQKNADRFASARRNTGCASQRK